MQRYASRLFSSRSPPRITNAQHGSVEKSPADYAEDAAQRAEDSANRVFRLERPAHAKGPVRIAAFGCHGDGSKRQLLVADKLASYLETNGNQVDFALLLGDNCYDYGADSSVDPKMFACFTAMYPKRSQHLRLPYFALPGNHDENRQHLAKRILKKEFGIPRIMHQIAHTFIDPDTSSYRSSINKFYNDPPDDEEKRAGMRTLQLADLNRYSMYWNMPRRYYSVIIEDVQVFLVDSNTYALDFLILQENLRAGIDTPIKENQAAWLTEQVAIANAAGRTIILAQHHPLYTPGKRAYHNDYNIYLDADQFYRLLIALNIHVHENRNEGLLSYNALLLQCYIKQGFVFTREQKPAFPEQKSLCIDTIISAHDHNFCYYNNKATAASDDEFPLCQIIAGTGGGELQDRYKFSDQHKLGGFLKKPGFVVLSHTKGNSDLEFEFISAKGKKYVEYVLHFSTATNQAITKYDGLLEDGQIKLIKDFFTVVKRAVNNYLHHIGDKQDEDDGNFLGNHSTHGHEGTNRAHKVWAYINHANQNKNYAGVIHDIYNMTLWNNGTVRKLITSPKEHSLITFLDEEMSLAYGKKMATFAERPCAIKESYAQAIEHNIKPSQFI